MSCLLDAPLLKADAKAIHRLDTRDPQNLFSVWTGEFWTTSFLGWLLPNEPLGIYSRHTAFVRCADSALQGRRLENLSWRLWTCKTFCVEPGNVRNSMSSSPLPRNIEHKIQPSSEYMPQLYLSVNSIASEESIDFSAAASPMEVEHPHICRQDSSSSRSRSNERHLTSGDFDKLVVSIVCIEKPLAPTPPLVALPLIISTPSVPEVKVATTPSRSEPPVLERSGSTSNSEPAKSFIQSINSSFSPPSHTVVRGFPTSHIPMFQTVTSPPMPVAIKAIPESTSSHAAKPVQPKTQTSRNQLVTRPIPAPAMNNQSKTKGEDVDESAIDS